MLVVVLRAGLADPAVGGLAPDGQPRPGAQHHRPRREQLVPADIPRVIAQGDMRPMAGNTEAMADLKRILAGREEFYAKADLCFDTSGKPLAETYLELRSALATRIQVPVEP